MRLEVSNKLFYSLYSSVYRFNSFHGYIGKSVGCVPCASVQESLHADRGSLRECILF